MKCKDLNIPLCIICEEINRKLYVGTSVCWIEYYNKSLLRYVNDFKRFIEEIDYYINFHKAYRYYLYTTLNEFYPGTLNRYEKLVLLK